IGLAYKPDVDDMRESPTFKIMDLLEEYGASVSYYDPHIPVIKPTREHDYWTGTESVEWNKPEISRHDAVIISTNHSEINYKELANWCNCIVDSRHVINGYAKGDKHIWMA